MGTLHSKLVVVSEHVRAAACVLWHIINGNLKKMQSSSNLEGGVQGPAWDLLRHDQFGQLWPVYTESY